jgi:branched-chain amino acid transport system ATP-binding protein
MTPVPSADAATPLLAVSGLDKAFGGVVAARDVSFAVDRGQMVALIGPNGAGKSTTFNMVGGQLAPDRGRVTLAGREITSLGPRRICKLGVGRTFQIAQTFVSMTVIENVQMALISHHGETRRPWAAATKLYRDQAAALLAAVELEPLAERPVAELAYGDVKRLELAIALAGAPSLLLMDEPTAGMAPKERAGLMQVTQRLSRERGIGVLFTEHDMDAVFGHADLILVLVRGEIIARGDAARIRADVRVREVYLGDSGTLAATRARRPGVNS